jgi:hypothetical protein
VAADPPRLLDKRAGRSYTTNPALAMFREPEAVDEETQRRISADARRRFAEDRADELARRDAVSRSVRLRNMQTEIRRLRIDARRELGVIDAQLDLLGRKAAQRRASRGQIGGPN